MASKKETVEIIDKLIELTQHNQIIWQSASPPDYMRGADSRVDLVYLTRYLGQIIRLYKKHYKYYIDESQFVWDERIYFEFIDENGSTLWEFPQTPNAYELLKSVMYRNSQVGSFYNELFKK